MKNFLIKKIKEMYKNCFSQEEHESSEVQKELQDLCQGEEKDIFQRIFSMESENYTNFNDVIEKNYEVMAEIIKWLLENAGSIANISDSDIRNWLLVAQESHPDLVSNSLVDGFYGVGNSL